MAKSSKKQCRKPKPPRQGGGLVVVSSRNLHAKGPNIQGHSNTGKKKTKKKNVLSDVMSLSGEDSDDFDASPVSSPPVCSDGDAATVVVVNKFLFSSSHSREQRLYYLLAVANSRPMEGATQNVSVASCPQEKGCHAVVFVETTAVAQELIVKLKALSLKAFAVHERTVKAQAKQHVKRFLSVPSAERSSVLVLTNAAVARSTVVGQVPDAAASFVRAVHFDPPEGPKNAAARARVVRELFDGRLSGMTEEVHLEGGGGSATLAPFGFEIGAMAGIVSRLAVAKKLARAGVMNPGEEGERGMQRAAAAVGLEWEDDDARGESGAEAVMRGKRRAHAQQVASLREKLSVLLCQPLLPPIPRAGGKAASEPFAQQSSKELRKKMAVLGMISSGLHGPKTYSVAGAPENRAAAQTRWLDGSAGRRFGGDWEGSSRTGASCDKGSLDLRARVQAAKQRLATGGRKKADAATVALAKWSPNPDTPDPERWGGRWGKPSGHNEVVLQLLRPFAPMEVVNTRVCSKASPAPGNDGFDGCRELLSLTCKAHERALTVWDDEAFLFIDKTGVCSSWQKQKMLPLSLPTLRFLVKNMRSSTVCCGGQTPPRELARAVVRLVGWGAKQSQFGSLSAELSTRVMSFVLSGDLATWRSVSAGFGVGPVRQAASSGSNQHSVKSGDTLAFTSKKKRKNFNL